MDRSRTGRKSWHVLIHKEIRYQGKPQLALENRLICRRQTEINTACIHMGVHLQVHILNRHVPNFLLQINLWFLNQSAHFLDWVFINGA